MKNILLVGNGFDLYYKLPTKYADFLHVVKFLLSNRNTDFSTIGDIFSQESLQRIDGHIGVCYTAHKKTFDATALNKELVSEIIKLTENNLWFSYLNTVFDKDIGWIDFEKEISFVLKCFEKAFEKSTLLHFKSPEKHFQYVIELFEFYIDKAASRNVVTIGTYKVNADYCIETPKGSGNNTVNTEKVVKKLYDELLNLGKSLKLYLKCFVENTFSQLKNDGTCTRIDFLSHIDKAITFNYTNTYENIYFNNSAFHLHGNVNEEVVLGVNPDESDTLNNINTTFVCFKKYFQRTLYETDQEYLKWINEYVGNKIPYRLFSMGHSLDVTDEDVIAELFSNAKEIVILYHDITAKKSYISNLVRMFGKEKFDILRKEKQLAFVSLEQDLTSLKAHLSEESWNDLRNVVDSEKGEEIVVV